uniref:Uncharacterized protein n=1 Tax=Rhizophora mucronata TaxID=61149 RepID=A0A2P2QWX0_RHIMU
MDHCRFLDRSYIRIDFCK